MSEDGYRYTVREIRRDDETDWATLRYMRDQMRINSGLVDVPYREGALEESENEIRNQAEHYCVLLAERRANTPESEDATQEAEVESLGVLIGNLQYLMAFDYLMAMCLFMYVLPNKRGHKVGRLLMTGFHQWAQHRKADDIRFLVTSGENIESTHTLFTELMGMVHFGGNYIYPLSEQGERVLKPYRRPAVHKKSETGK